MGEINLVKAKLSDVDFLFRIDNDLEYRKNSFNQNQITYEEHLKWFQEKLLSKDTVIYICMDNDIPIGMVRLDIVSKEKCLISYVLDKSHRGQGGMEN